MAIETIILPSAVVFACVTALWFVSVRLKDASIADIWWGPGFAVIAAVLVVQHPEPSPHLIAATAVLAIWGLRLGTYLWGRNVGHEEDPRYQAMRRHSPGFWWVSLFKVFYLQGALQLTVALPVFATATLSSALNFGDYASLFVALFGIALEATADAQLTRFKRDPLSSGSVLRTGVWGWCRHPNYFGNALIWLGIGSLALNGGADWWTLLGPAVMWFLLLKVSGVSMLESTIVDRRPEYRRYIEEVPAFFPNPFRRR